MSVTYSWHIYISVYVCPGQSHYHGNTSEGTAPPKVLAHGHISI